MELGYPPRRPESQGMSRNFTGFLQVAEVRRVADIVQDCARWPMRVGRRSRSTSLEHETRAKLDATRAIRRAGEPAKRSYSLDTKSGMRLRGHRRAKIS